MIYPSAPCLTSSNSFQTVLSGAKDPKVRSSEGFPLLSYTLDQWREILQFIESEAYKTPMMYPEGIRIAKGEVVNMTNHTVPFIEPYP